MKPVLTIYIKGPMTLQQREDTINLIPISIKEDYHVLVVAADRTDVTIVSADKPTVHYQPEMETR